MAATSKSQAQALRAVGVLIAAATLGAGPAFASIATPPPLSISSFYNAYFEVGGDRHSITTPGGAFLNGGPNGAGSVEVHFGADPSVSVAIAPAVGVAGDGIVDIVYSVEYVDPSPMPSVVTVDFKGGDSLSVGAGSGTASSLLYVFVAGFTPFPVAYYPYIGRHCVSTELGCDLGTNAAGGPYGAQSFDMAPNTIYHVEMKAWVSGYATSSAAVDPTFSAPAGAPGRFIFSPDVAAVPEPATWSVMLLGFGSVGAAMRARRRRASVEPTTI
jgi:hypothetical protein